VEIVALPAWLWYAAFLGAFSFGGICAALAWHWFVVMPLREELDSERETIPSPHPPCRPQFDTLPSL
jgi:hypothetical protein